jgi:tRNA(Arg) A34 adenosine deaminase TadA
VSENSDRAFLQRAVALAADCLTKPTDGPFGAVVVRDGRIIAEGQNRVTQDNDPTAHAEVVAIRNACATEGTFHLRPGAVLYTSCEPCPMCLAAAYWAHVERIVFASDRNDAAKAGFDDAFLYEEMPKPPGARRLQMTRLALTEADAVFKAWTLKPDKIAY